MFCTRCGEKLKEDNLYCPACGHKVQRQQEEGKPIQLIAQKKPMPLWFKGLVILAFLALVAVTVAIFFAQNPKKTVEEQLKALKTNHITDAYFHYTTSGFQRGTSLDAFKEFIRENPVFLDYFTFRIGKSQTRNQIGIVKATLFSEKEETISVEYRLGKEDGKWKILTITLLDDIPPFLPLTREQSQKLEDSLFFTLFHLKNSNPQEVYEMASAEFQAATPWEDFLVFLRENPLFSRYLDGGMAKKGLLDDKAHLLLFLRGENKMGLYEVIYKNEGGDWKMWRLDASSSLAPFVPKYTELTSNQYIPK